MARGFDGTGGMDRGTTPPCLPVPALKFLPVWFTSVMECDPEPGERGADVGVLMSFRGTDDERERDPFRRTSSLLRVFTETTGLPAVTDRPGWDSRSRMLSGVKVYCIVWSLWMSSSKLRTTSIRACMPSSEVLTAFSLIDEGESDECCCRFRPAEDSRGREEDP